jgi:hypothetical protein
MEARKHFAEIATPYIFWILSFIFIALFFFDLSSYLAIIREDSLAEWLTFVFLVATGIVSLLTGLKIKKRYGYLHWFFLLFFAFNILAGLEEISWGQRVFGMETKGVFAKYSDQNEINLHNTMQGLVMVKTKHIAMYVLFIYGVIFPWLVKRGKISAEWLKRYQLIIPPLFLRGGFLVASLLMIDIPTGQEEEIGEFYYSICFFLMVLYNLFLSANSDAFSRESQEIRSKRTPSFNE